MSDWRVNRGFMPKEAAGKRVAVKLRNGSISGDKPVTPYSPAGWPADGRGGCRWSHTKGHASAFDIVEYRIL